MKVYTENVAMNAWFRTSRRHVFNFARICRQQNSSLLPDRFTGKI